ncbi:MAG: hypothetical protein AAF533_30330 [Acidobacteriota bacterium]
MRSALALSLVFLFVGSAHAQLTPYDASAVIESYCSPNMNDYGTVDDCSNYHSPPLPSLVRAVSTPDPDFHPARFVANFDANMDGVVDQAERAAVGHPLPIDANTTTWPRGPQAAGGTQVLPFTRITNDGRLSFIGGASRPELWLFRPDRLDHDLEVKSAPGPVGERAFMSFAMLHDPDPLRTDLDYSPTQFPAFQGPDTVGLTICDVSGSGHDLSADIANERNPRPCLAEVPSSSPVEGDCYDITVLTAFSAYDRDDAYHWELRSVDLTVFVSEPKTAQADVPRSTPSPPTADDAYWIYPRTSAYQIGRPPTYHVGMHVSDFTSTCSSPTPPAWCEFLPMQSWMAGDFHLDDDGDGVVDPGETWDGTAMDDATGPIEPLMWDGFPKNALGLMEMVTSADGMLLFFNSSRGIYYSVNEVAPCQAEGFRVLKPLSHFPSDPLTQDYDLAKTATTFEGKKVFRTANGRPIRPGWLMLGAYPWVDREVKNMVWAQVNASRDAYHSVDQAPPQGSKPYYAGDPDQGTGKAVSVVGAWTQGKTVILDNMLNPTVWSGDRDESNFIETLSAPEHRFLHHMFAMDIYSDSDPLWIRPLGRQRIMSPENHLNLYDALTPKLPFDVSWLVSTDAQLNAELPFDEYLRNDAFVVAHMNSTVFWTLAGGRWEAFHRDGFLPPGSGQPNDDDVLPGSLVNDIDPGFRFRESPRLQNASCADPAYSADAAEGPRTLRVRGGARVEPVAMGGVLGKGLYFDGANDFVDMGYRNTHHDDWYYGIWLESREPNRNGIRNVFFWPDGSWLGMSRTKIRIHNGAVGASPAYHDIDISGHGLELGEWYHLGVKSLHDGNQRTVRVYLNGNPRAVGSVSWRGGGGSTWNDGFSMDLDYLDGWSWFVLGDPGPGFRSPGLRARFTWRGWMDEFRIYKLDASKRGNGWFDEFACNLALGTLREEDTFRPEPDPDIGSASLRAGASLPDWPLNGGQAGATRDLARRQGEPLSPARMVGMRDDDEQLEGRPVLGRAFEHAHQEHPEPVLPTADPSVVAELERLWEQRSLEETAARYEVARADSMRKQELSGELATRRAGGIVVDAGIATHGSRGDVPSRGPRGGGGPAPKPPVRWCEQLALQSHDTPLELGPQRGVGDCVDKVHANPDPDPEIAETCIRERVLGIDMIPIEAGQPRGDFSGVEFCHSCHLPTSPVPGLGLDALAPGSVLREHDPRRQPLDWPATLGGCQLELSPFPPGGGCDPGLAFFLLDPTLDPGDRIEP